MTLGTWIITASQREASPAVEYKSKGKWVQFTWPEYSNKILSAYSFLRLHGLAGPIHVGLMSSTRWEWAALDLAILGSGAVTVPMYPNLSNDDMLFIINNSDINVLIIENETMQNQIDQIKDQFQRPLKVIMISEIDFDFPVSNEISSDFYKKCASLNCKDTATIIYTSGTTGRPKGVVLLHEAIASEVEESFALFNVKPSYKSLTFLPFAHILGRLEHWGSCHMGHCVAYAESIEKVKPNLVQVKPDFIVAVPRIFEKVYAGIMAQIETNSMKQTLFNEALSAAIEVEKFRKTKMAIPWALLLKYEALNKLAFAPIREAFGGRLKFAISGGAPLDSKLTDFFFNCGIPILEGYGLSETTGAITINTLAHHLIGTVGQPIGEVKIKIADDGEILIKSKKCMKEYYKTPDETSQVIKNGYFYTGDIGEFTTGGFLKITDRKKDLIKTDGGKYVAPQKLEGLLKQEPLISHVLIHGDQKKYILALITVDKAQIKQWAQNLNLKLEHDDEIFSNMALKSRLQKHIQLTNTKLASYEAIKKFEILRDEWTIENGALTQSLKVKRKHLERKYADLIAEIYDIPKK
jgi:long-chain acyl-CoA synthetase